MQIVGELQSAWITVRDVQAYPFPRHDADKALHALLGEINQELCHWSQGLVSEVSSSLLSPEHILSDL